jgi:hypothetical protein
VRAFNPWPVAETRLHGEPVKLLRSRVAPMGQSAQRAAPHAAPGTVLGLSGAALEVACGEGVLQVLELQRAGRRPVVARDFLNAESQSGGPPPVLNERTGGTDRWCGDPPRATALAIAARALALVVDDGCTAETALARVDPPLPERAAVRAILSGTLRWYLRLAPAVEALLQRGQTMHQAVRAVLVTALHQIEYSRAAPESVANIAVDAVRVAGHGSAADVKRCCAVTCEREAVLQRRCKAAGVAGASALVAEGHSRRARQSGDADSSGQQRAAADDATGEPRPRNA